MDLVECKSIIIEESEQCMCVLVTGCEDTKMFKKCLDLKEVSGLDIRIITFSFIHPFILLLIYLFSN